MAAKDAAEAEALGSETSEEQVVVENSHFEADLSLSIEPVVYDSRELVLAQARPKEDLKKKKPSIRAILGDEKVITEASDEARELYNQSRFGVIIENGKVELSLLEGLYLFERGKLDLRSQAGRRMSFESFVKKARKAQPNFWIRYSVFKDIRNRGYIIKTALKFGADFRVYDRGVKPGEDHARWVVFAVHEGQTLTWHEFSSKNRVAHSTKKRLLIGVVDDERDVTYYEVKWTKP